MKLRFWRPDPRKASTTIASGSLSGLTRYFFTDELFVLTQQSSSDTIVLDADEVEKLIPLLQDFLEQAE